MKIRQATAKIAVLVALLASTSVAMAGETNPTAASELSSAIELLRAHHMNSSKLDWTAVTAQAEAMIAGKHSPEAAYPAIWYVIDQLGEKHTSLIPAESWQAAMSAPIATSPSSDGPVLPTSYTLPGPIGVLHLTELMASEAVETAYVNAVRTEFAKFKSDGVCRIIVDLRDDRGGNMWPMLNGVSALLGPPPYGHFIHADGSQAIWDLYGGMIDEGKDDTPSGEAYKGPKGYLPVAVLLSRQTASAGEFTAMAFEGRPRTEFFGEPSAGYLTINAPFALPDGARLAISGGWATDRLRKPYKVAMVPDQNTPPGAATLDRAAAWLSEQHCGYR